MTSSSAPTAEKRSTGIDAAAFLLRDHGVDVSQTALLAKASGRAVGHDEPNAEDLAALLTEHDFETRVVTTSSEALWEHAAAVPFLARLKTGAWVVVTRLSPDDDRSRLWIHNPRRSDAGIIPLTPVAFSEWWNGEIVVAAPSSRPERERETFGFRWFLPLVAARRGAVVNAVVAALGVTAMGLAVPIFFQIVVDKVLVHNGVSTLQALLVGVVAALLFEATFLWLRGWYLQFLSSHLDIALARRSFRHLMALPIGFFDRALAGVVTRQMLQAGQIREFLTGRVFSSLMDLPAFVIVLPILFHYDALLATLVLCAAFVLAGVVGLLLGPYRRRLRLLYTIEAERQAILVESIHGIRTVKSLGLEERRSRLWSDTSAASAMATLDVGRISLFANALSQLLEKGLGVLVISVGAFEIFAGRMSVGELVAFQMLAGRVTSPVVQIIGLLNQLQEALLSVSMLREIMDHPPERDRSGLTPALTGRITLEGVSFRYAGSDRTAIDRVDLDVPAGTMLGVVGRSGSGKSTLSALIQGLHVPSEGVVRFDGVSVREIDLAHLRSSIGVVPQDPFLFRGSVKDNIRMGAPGMSFAEIVAAAQRAGAHEFIEEMPQGYDTVIDENASNLSGGQRQRICLARAIARHPPILILDEATSALDPESETVVVRNLRRIGADRTTVLITHRLQTVRGADRIIVLDRGRIIASGRHDQLLARPGLYRDLWLQQTEGGLG